MTSMTVQCTCNKNKHKRYTVFIFFKSIQLIISPQWLWTSQLVDIFFEKLADRIKKRGVGFIWCSPSFEITKSYYMFLVFGIILKKWLFLYFKKNYYSWMYLERILKKITRPIHTPPQINDSWVKREAQLLLVCALSVSPARNWFFACGIKIRFFYSMENSYIFRIGGTKEGNSGLH